MCFHHQYLLAVLLIINGIANATQTIDTHLQKIKSSSFIQELSTYYIESPKTTIAQIILPFVAGATSFWLLPKIVTLKNEPGNIGLSAVRVPNNPDLYRSGITVGVISAAFIPLLQRATDSHVALYGGLAVSSTIALTGYYGMPFSNVVSFLL